MRPELSPAPHAPRVAIPIPQDFPLAAHAHRVTINLQPANRCVLTVPQALAQIHPAQPHVPHALRGQFLRLSHQHVKTARQELTHPPKEDPHACPVQPEQVRVRGAHLVQSALLEVLQLIVGAQHVSPAHQVNINQLLESSPVRTALRAPSLIPQVLHCVHLALPVLFLPRAHLLVLIALPEHLTRMLALRAV